MAIPAIIYGRETGIVRRIVSCDSAAEVYRLQLAEGEAVLVPPDGADLSPAGCATLIGTQIGKAPEDSRCIVIDGASAEIVSVIEADPTIDVPGPGLTLFQEPEAVPGWQPDPETGAFVPPPGTEKV